MRDIKLFEDGFVVSDEYQDSEIYNFQSSARALVHVRNTNASLTMYYTIYGSLDKENWRTEVAEQTLTAGLGAVHEITKPWAYLKVRSKIAPWGPLTSCWAHTTVNDTWIDETADAASPAGGDIKIAPQGNSPGSRKDFIYYGCGSQFALMKITIDYKRDYPDTEGIGWEYWNGSEWVRFPSIDDETDGNRVQAAELEVSFDIPADWAPCQVNTDATALYYIRFGGYANAQANATAAQAWVYVASGTISALIGGKSV